MTRGGQLVVSDVPDPVPSSGHVVVRSLSAGICGSDLHALADFGHFTGLMDSVGVPALDAAADCVFGHEFCAEIVDHGPDTAGTLPVGTRVCSVPIILGPTGVEQIGYSNAYPGALAEHMVLQELLLLPVPDSLDTDLAALTEPLAVGEHAVGLAGLSPGQPCLVVGCGPVGLAVIAALKGRGHGPVLAADFSPTRRRLAEAFGADEVIDPAQGSPHDRWSDFGIARTVMERIGSAMLGGNAPDPVIFEAVGVPGMLQSLIADGPPHSRIVVVVHAHRHHRALHGGDQGDGAALLLRVHARRVRRHTGAPGRRGARSRPPGHLHRGPGRCPRRLRHSAHPGRARQDPGDALICRTVPAP
ncbi:MAG TPA: alcohol dehydrogenase catalytic domain-containing protein [Acidimicrobiales bacterium]|nr:alcohol dehydrogenase catalytic domain-containing protein [Acidimicrobiales bacterium]